VPYGGELVRPLSPVPHATAGAVTAAPRPASKATAMRRRRMAISFGIEQPARCDVAP
jgi:hypothetical protein